MRRNSVSQAPTALNNNMPNQEVAAWLLALVAVIAVPANIRGETASSQPQNAITGIVAAFEQHPIVFIGEAHWLRQAGDFYVQLVQDPRFQRSAQEIVIEFASRSNQPLVDRYVDGESIPMEEVRHIWRDTTKVAGWESPIYAQWLAAIREVNQNLPAGHKLLVLAGDTPVDWSRIHSHSDWAKLGNNDSSFTDVIVNQVLTRKRRALVVLGSNHVTKSGDRDGYTNTTTEVEKRYPGCCYVILIHARETDAIPEESLGFASEQSPALFDAYSLSRMRGMRDLRISERADALLYLGPRKSLRMAYPAKGTLEPEYLREIDRRSMIEWGELRARQFLGPAGNH